ncbi:hypothetical protein MIMGU_mgv1a024987mg [Erythranthe guttata]|uniref:Transcription repressor n=2 Tax=Erythranthe guttata TaxID=4155 RepID=A0A022RB16_ERYGU|nr:hypothetical protein MIMGU_mgv1a024987mg [Erythranthe guttata]
MKIPSIFKNKEAKQPWQSYWPLCTHPKTLSFRASNEAIFTTTTFLSFDTTNSLECSVVHEDNESLEVVVNGVRLYSSERLFFEPDETSSIVQNYSDQCIDRGLFVFKDSVALEMESDNPYLDFKKSMQEMVERDQANNNFLVKDSWDYLEELLGWYLRLNVKINHRFIVGAFVDLLNGLARDKGTTMCSSESTSYSSASSSF